MYFISVQSTLISIGLISKGAVFVGPICTYISKMLIYITDYIAEKHAKQHTIIDKNVIVYQTPLYYLGKNRRKVKRRRR